MKSKRLVTLLIIVLAANLYAQQPGTLKWKFIVDDTGRSTFSSPSIAPDGTVYVGGGGKFSALNPDGTKKYSGVVGASAIGADGMMYGSSGQTVFAVNPDCTVKWFVYISNATMPAIGSDGTLFFGGALTNMSTYRNIVYALNSDGTEKWSFKLNDRIDTFPVIGHDGTVYVGASYFLKALNPDGTEKWSFNIKGFFHMSSPAIGSDGTIYAAPWDKKLYAINPDGTEKWSFTANDLINTSPVIGPDGTIYVGSQDRRLYAINPDGTKKWSFNTGMAIYSTPAIGSDSTVYVGSDKVYALNPNGKEKWSFVIGGVGYVERSSSPTIDTDGTLYIGANNSTFFAIHTSSRGLAQSSWPKNRKDNQNRANMQLQFPPDHIAPSPVTNLSVKKISDNVYMLLWRATGDDNNKGNAANYNIRFSTSAPDTNLDSWWLKTYRVANMPKPSTAGSRDSVIISNTQERTYYFAIKVGDEVGNWSTLSNIVEVNNHTVGITTENKIPTEYNLFQNYPNPFNPETVISYKVQATSHVTIKVYNLLGSEVATLVNEEKSVGNHSIIFDGRNLASGVYLYKMQAGNFVETKKLIMIK